jgi:hypothetical protein
MSGLRMVGLGLAGVLLGAILPFLMVIRVIEPSFLLSFIAFVISVGGLFLGMLGAAQHMRGRE